MINVSKPSLPPLQEYQKYVEGIFQRNWLTNHGPLVCELEQKLAEYLQANYFLFLSNGTIALQIAIKALELKGEIITTPFSYVATTSSIAWENCIPVFADIHPKQLTIDPAAIESKITERTTGIIATHVYGNACDVDAIEKIASKYNLKVIYDAAHAFGSRYNNKSLVSFGDVSTLSFHATKLFHTIEGGAVITPHKEVYNRMAYLRNFGHNGPEAFHGIGVNGKNSEFHAAMGLCNLRFTDDVIAKRKSDFARYKEKLAELPLEFPEYLLNSEPNFSYVPIIFNEEQTLLRVVDALKKNDVTPRRYFYPSLDTLPYVGSQVMEISRDISKRVLCLPTFYDLTAAEIDMISGVVSRAMAHVA